MSATPPGLDVADSFTTLSNQVVHYLRTHTPLSDWSVNRVAAGEQVHLHVEGDGLLNTGDRIDWDQSLCQLVVEHDAPPVVPDLTAAPLFRDRPLPGIEGIFRAAVHGELRGVEIDASTLPQMLATLRAWGRVGEIEQLGASIEVDVGPIVDWRVQPGSTTGSCPAMIAAHSLALAGDLRGALQPIAACWDAPGAQVGETLAVVAAELERRPDPHVYAALRELVDSSQRSSVR